MHNESHSPPTDLSRSNEALLFTKPTFPELIHSLTHRTAPKPRGPGRAASKEPAASKGLEPPPSSGSGVRDSAKGVGRRALTSQKILGASRASHLPSEHIGVLAALENALQLLQLQPAERAAVERGCLSEGCGSSRSACIAPVETPPVAVAARRRPSASRRPPGRELPPQPGPVLLSPLPARVLIPTPPRGGTCCDARDLGGVRLWKGKKTRSLGVGAPSVRRSGGETGPAT